MHYRLVPVLFLLACILQVKAGLTITGSRIVYDERTGETSVLVRKTVGDEPSLMQVWLDDGRDIDPQQLNVPFVLTPAVARLEPNRGQSVRVVRTGGGLPEDRESLFWLNVLEIPARPEGLNQENIVAFSSRARIKFFYRPRGLRGNPDRAYEGLRFSLDSAQPDGLVRLRVRNSSPYHVTLKYLKLQTGTGEDAPVLAEMNQMTNDRMVSPMGELVIPLEMAATAGRSGLASARLQYGVVNDYGGTTDAQGRFD